MKPLCGARRRQARREQRGVVLIVALLVLVIIGLMSASIMRGALSSDLIANNARVQTLASHAAQIALRYCEDQTTANVVTIHVEDAVALEENHTWHTFTKWSDANIVNDVPPDFLQSADSTFTPATAPQCIVQKVDLGGGKTVYQVTARGFSPDYSADEAGHTLTGSVVWLQSVVSL
jgi:type IV pilus assembly protein PilX